MLFWLILIPVCLIVVTSLLSWWNYHLNSDGLEACLVGLWAITAIAVILCAIFTFEWAGAGSEARVLNAKYGTEYTQDDLFWAGDTIKLIIEGQRQRIDITGIK